MKSIVLIIFLISISYLAEAQLTGNGLAPSTAYSGTFEGDPDWNFTNFPGGKVYINGDVTIDDELLNIEAGMSIIFVAEGADLILTNTGQLNAVGSSGNEITFTADDDNDGNFGETAERWGHIVFWNMDGSAGNSTLEYCAIEWGDVSGSSNTTTYGGGLFIRSFSGLSITNCRITNNKATHGGGIRALKDGIYPASSPSITNSIISQNIATVSGGGILLDTDSNASITNCIISYNSSGLGGGGGIFLNACSNVRVINSNFTKNTTSRTDGGRNIQFYYISSSTNRPKFINCIAWGDDNSIAYINASRIATDLTNCAIQDVSTPASLYTSCIDLNATNDAATGPNFLDPDLPGVNWSISFDSPCRDAGTTPSPAVATDYEGNSRIGVYDIGAYEVQYSRWLSSASSPTSWATPGNWEQGLYPDLAGTTGDVVIPYLINDANAPDISGTTSIAAGKSMILEPGGKATFGTLTNNGILKLESDATNISSLIATSYSGNAADVELYLTGGGTLGSYKWHYISIPFTTTVPVSTFTGVTQDIASYNEPRVSSDVTQGWIGYDGWIYSTPEVDFDATYAFSSLTSGRGYEYYDAANNKFTLSGTLNTADVSPTITFKSGGIDAVNGFNLLGNPFPSGLDWDYIIAQGNFPANTSKSLYFTLNNQLASYIAGVGVPAGVNGFIPPMQGFMTKTYDENHTIVLAAAARTHSMHARYKGKSLIPLVRLSIAEGTSADETVVRFDELAKSYLDNDFDAVKMSVSPENLLIYSSLGGVNYVINGQPFPETTLEIPIVVNLKQDGNHTINTTEFQGLDIYNVYLIDNSTGFTADLKTTPVLSFSANAGNITDRFILKVSSLTTEVENPLVVSDNTFNIYPGNNNINIQTISDDWDGKTGSVRVLDLTGKIASDLQNVEFSKNSLVQVQSPGATGIYIVEIKSGLRRYVGKVVIK